MSVGYDTIIGAHVLDEQRPSNLVDQCSVEIGVDNWGKGLIGFGTDDGDPADLLEVRGKKGLQELWGEEGMAYYNARDTAYTHMLFEVQREKLQGLTRSKEIMQRLILPGVAAFAEVELNGIWVDPDRLAVREAEVNARVEQHIAILLSEHVHPDLRAQWDEKYAKKKQKKPLLQNPNFLRAWLFGEEPLGLGLLPVKYTDKGREPSTDKEVLNSLSDEHPAIAELQAMLKDVKTAQFFASWRDWLGSDGRLHPSFNLTGTVTGRRSCNNPNLQQVPRDSYVRAVLGAPPGWVILGVDYAQIEVRIAAWLAGEEKLLAIFAEGGDPYISAAAQVLGKRIEDVTPEERQKAKAYVLGFLYGMGAKGFVSYAKETYGVVFTFEEAEEIRDGFFAAFPGLVRWHQEQKRLAERNRMVESPTGRLRHLMNIEASNWSIRGKAERQAINSPVQGTGGDFVLASIIELLEILPQGEVLIIGDIHDEVLFQIREEVWVEHARTILQVMEKPRIIRELGAIPPIRMMAEGSVGTHWSKQNPEFTLEGGGKKKSLDEVAAEVTFDRAAA